MDSPSTLRLPEHGAARRRLRTLPTRALHRHRRLIVALLAGLAVWAGVDQVATARSTVTVLTFTRDIPLGETLSPDVVRPIELPTGSEPAGALTRLPRESRLTGAVRAGEVLTDARVSSSSLPDPPAGTVIVPVPLTGRAAEWLQPGQQILLFPSSGTDPLMGGTGADTGTPATVLTPSAETDRSDSPADVRVVTALVAVERRYARSLAQESDTGSLVPVFVP